MPITVGAIRSLRSDRKRAAVNARVRDAFRQAVSSSRKKPTVSNLDKAYKLLDRAAKAGIIHKNKAGRLKSRLARLVKKK